jgi:hypothetical protein
MHMSNAAAGIAARGWKIVRLHGVRPDGGCTCGKGRDCPTPGKHPVARRWQAEATDDEDAVLSLYEDDTPWNVGLLLGPQSRVVDVEFDSDEGRRFAEELNLSKSATPTYKSARSVHRLFAWDESMPPVAVRKVRGLEVRIGGGGAAAQSVLPPSKHHSGVQYEWVAGLSPDDVELQPLPERLSAMLWNEGDSSPDGGGRTPRPSARRVLDGAIKEGSRNSELYRFAVREAFRIPNLDDPQEQADLLLKVQMVNKESCRPPMERDEVRDIYRSAIAYRRKCDAAGIETVAAIERADAPEANRAQTGRKPGAEPGAADADAGGAEESETFNKLTRWGLSFHPPRNDPNGESEWWPGEWKLTIVHSDPREYRVTVPAWQILTQDGTGSVSLTTAQFEVPAKVASAVLERTGKVLLNENPEQWRQMWLGRPARPGGAGRRPRRAVRGLMSKLMDNADEEWPGESSLRYVVLASWLLDRLLQAQPPQEDDAPCPTGRATWRGDSTLWFAWNRTWEDIERQHRLGEGERLSIKRRLCALFGSNGDFRHCKHKHSSGKTVSYVVWTRRELALLEKLATEGGSNSPSI